MSQALPTLRWSIGLLGTRATRIPTMQADVCQNHAPNPVENTQGWAESRPSRTKAWANSTHKWPNPAKIGQSCPGIGRDVGRFRSILDRTRPSSAKVDPNSTNRIDADQFRIRPNLPVPGFDQRWPSSARNRPKLPQHRTNGDIGQFWTDIDRMSAKLGPNRPSVKSGLTSTTFG